MDMFETAARKKMRFESIRGLLTVEDLFDLPLSSPSGNRASLDAVAIELQRQQRESAGIVSFVAPSEDTGAFELQLKLDLVKYVIDVKLAERRALADAAKRADTKQAILGIIAKKQHAELEGMSVADLTALVESL